MTYKVLADDPSIVIKKNDKQVYDHLVIFSPTVEKMGGSLIMEAIVEIVDDEGNVLIAGSSRGGGVIFDVRFAGCFSSSHNHNPEDPIITGLDQMT